MPMFTQRFRNAALAVCFFAVAALAAENPFIGTWKMNADKSKMSGADALQNVTVQYEMDGESLKASVQGTTTQGQAENFTYEATLDGKPGTATGSSTFDTITLQKVGPNVIKATAKKGDKAIYMDRRVVSKDGKTLTISRTGTDSQGKKYQSTIVFDRQ
jgi:hypothetical protein